MIITSIQIENFQCFYGKGPEIELGRGANVIYGRNGAGKSRLFNAFCWCFMNKFYETTGGWSVVRNAQHLEALVSETAKANLDEFDVAVEIRFDLNEEEVGLHDLSLRRSFHVSKAGISSPEVALTFREGRDYKEITNDADVTRRLDAWFDHEIRQYMWFQGETLDELVNFEERDSLQTLTAKISHYRHYEDLLDDCRAFQTYAKRKLETAQSANAKDRRRSAEIQTELRNTRNELDKHGEHLAEIESNIKGAELTIKAADEVITKTAASAAELEKFKASERKFEKIGDDLNALRREYASRERSGDLLALQIESAELFFSGIEQLESLLNRRKEELGAEQQTISLEIPSATDLQKLIDAERCDVCGTEAKVGSEPYEHMVARLQEMLSQSEKAGELRKLNTFQREIPELHDLLRRKIELASSLQTDFKKEEKSLEGLWVHARDDMRKLKDELKGAPESAANFEETKRRKERADRLKRENEAAYRRQLDRKFTLENTIKARERELAGLSSDADVDPMFKENRALADYALRLMGDIRDHEREKLLDDIEKEANLVYADFLKGAVGVIARLRIDRTAMNVELVDPEGREVPDPNSANWMAAKVALVTSILKLTKERLGRDYPMISDAATSHMDEDNAKNYVRVTSSMFEQTIIISKDFQAKSIKELAGENVRFYSLNPMTVDGKEVDGQKSSTRDLKVEIRLES